jgi:hypothetical protein
LFLHGDHADTEKPSTGLTFGPGASGKWSEREKRRQKKERELLHFVSPGARRKQH